MKKPPVNSTPKNVRETAAGAAPRLSIIVLNYNGWDWTKKCLDSLQNIVEKDQVEVIVVDNASTDDSLQHLRKYPGIQLVEAAQNRGFSAGNNLGIQYAQAPFIMLLNSDAEIRPNTKLLTLLDNFSDPRVGIVTPRIELPTGELDHACHRGFPTPWNAACYYSGVGTLFPRFRLVAGYRQSWKDFSTIHTVDACSGAAMIVRQSALPAVGLLDEDFFMYAEDIDWCYRFAELGYSTLYDPTVIIIHHKHKSGLSTSSWETKERSISAFFDTMKQFMNKHYQRRYPRFVLRLSSAMIDLLKYWKLTSERKKYERAASL